MHLEFAVKAVKGVQQAIANAKELERQIQRRAMRASLTKASRIVVREVKKSAPVKTGALKRSIRAKISTSKKDNSVSARIGADKKVTSADGKNRPARYLHLVELGHGGPAGAPPKPFLRPAAERSRAEAVRVYSAELGPAVLKVASKIKK